MSCNSILQLSVFPYLCRIRMIHSVCHNHNRPSNGKSIDMIHSCYTPLLDVRINHVPCSVRYPHDPYCLFIIPIVDETENWSIRSILVILRYSIIESSKFPFLCRIRIIHSVRHNRYNSSNGKLIDTIHSCYTPLLYFRVIYIPYFVPYPHDP